MGYDTRNYSFGVGPLNNSFNQFNNQYETAAPFSFTPNNNYLASSQGMPSYDGNMPQKFFTPAELAAEQAKAAFTQEQWDHFKGQQAFGNKMGMLGMGLQGLSSLGGLWLGYNQLQNARDMFDYQKGLSDRNLANTAQSYNQTRETRIRGARNSAYMTDAEKAAQNKLISDGAMTGTVLTDAQKTEQQKQAIRDRI
jgi:hypothetical protein